MSAPSPSPNTEHVRERLDALVAQSTGFLERMLTRYQKPMLLWSGGKDSTVLLHLALQIKPDMPVVQYRDPWFPRRWVWMQSLAADWGFTLFDYPPTYVGLYHQDGGLAAVSQYHIGNDRYLQLPRDIIDWTPDKTGDHNRWLCAREEFLGRPTGTMSFPWDLMLIGHKTTDEDPLLGQVALLTDHVEHTGDKADMADLAFPLRDWTDDDIWNYIEVYQVPMQASRYDIVNRRSRPDKRENSDYLPMCVNCVDCRGTVGEMVPCPKYGTIPNVSDLVPYVDSLEHDYFTAENPKAKATDSIPST